MGTPVSQSPGPGDDSRKNWKKIAELDRRLTGLQRDFDEANGGGRRRREFDNGRDPFRVFLPNLLYKFAPDDRATIEPTAWRLFNVQHGYTNFVATTGCSGEGSTPTDITVPESTALFYIWVDFTDPDAPFIAHTTFPGSVATHWADYPTLPEGIRPIAKIVTTDTAPATVRQLQWGDIWPSGSGGGLPTWLP